jgi:hypothetical protein
MKASSAIKAALVTSAALGMFSAIGPSVASGGNNALPRFSGIVQSRPLNGIGTWRIGGRSFIANRATQFDPNLRSLTVGSCAKVRYFPTTRIAQEIDKEPIADCR